MWVITEEAKKFADPEMIGRVIDDSVRNEQEIKKRIVKTKGTRTQERAKQSAIKSERAMKAVLKSTDGGDHWTEISRNPGLPMGAADVATVLWSQLA